MKLVNFPPKPAFLPGSFYLNEWDYPFSYPNWKSSVTPFLPISLQSQSPVSSAPHSLLNLSAICISAVVATPGSENPHPWPDKHQFLPRPLFPVLSLLPFLPTHFLIYKSGYATFQLNSLIWLLVEVRMKSIFLLGQ